ncbi:hypothetical protein ACHQM5_018529 [Ranunculus cassubicifolius]
MSLARKISLFPASISLPQFPKTTPNHFNFPNSRTFSCYFSNKQLKSHYASFVIRIRQGNGCSSSETQNYTNPNDGENVNDESRQTEDSTSIKFSERLKKYGLSGILSYGLLNTVYYLTTFCFVWFYVAPSPGRMGYVAAVERFLKIMAMVWVGSQVTKIARAAGALALAPLVSKGLTWFTVKFNLESEGKAFMAAVGVCIGIALLLFLVITLLSA